METEELSAVELRERMAQRGIRLGDLAQACGMYPSALSALLRGQMPMSERRRARIASAIVRLRLDQEHVSEPVAPAIPTFRIRRIV